LAINDSGLKSCYKLTVRQIKINGWELEVSLARVITC